MSSCDSTSDLTTNRRPSRLFFKSADLFPLLFLAITTPPPRGVSHPRADARLESEDAVATPRIIIIVTTCRYFHTVHVSFASSSSSSSSLKEEIALARFLSLLNPRWRAFPKSNRRCALSLSLSRCFQRLSLSSSRVRVFTLTLSVSLLSSFDSPKLCAPVSLSLCVCLACVLYSARKKSGKERERAAQKKKRETDGENSLFELFIATSRCERQKKATLYAMLFWFFLRGHVSVFSQCACSTYIYNKQVSLSFSRFTRCSSRRQSS